MGKDYKQYESSYIGGVAPSVQKNHKDLKSTKFNKELDQFRKKSGNSKKK